jgi:hypothetical protein
MLKVKDYMMYKLWHYLFGWDYIYWENIADCAIARIHTTHERELNKEQQ